MMRGLNLRGVRRALAHSRGMRLVVGLLALSLLLPPQLGFAAELNYALGGGVNTANTIYSPTPTTEPAFPSSFVANLLQNAVPCPPDVPILTLPNGDANRNGRVDEDDYRIVEAALGSDAPDADLNGDGVVKDDDLAIVKAHLELSSDPSWGNFDALDPQNWYTLQFAVQLGDYVGSANHLIQVNLHDLGTGDRYTLSVRLMGAPLQVVEARVPTRNRYAVQVVAPQGGSWLTISRTDVQATAPAPNTFGTPFPWQGSFPVPYGVVNPANGNLMVGLGLVGWGGQAGVAFGLTYNSNDTREGVLGVGWRHSYEAYLVDHPKGLELHEPDGRVLVFAVQPDGSYVAMKGVYDRLRALPNGGYELIRASQVRWVFDALGRLIAIRDLHNQGVSLEYNSEGQLSRVVDTTGRALELGFYGANAPQAWQGRLQAVRMENDPLQREWRFEYLPAGLNETGTAVVRLNKIIFPRLSYDANDDGIYEEDDPGSRYYELTYTNFGSDIQPRYLLTLMDDRERLGVAYHYEVSHWGQLECAGYSVLGRPSSGGSDWSPQRAPVCATPIRACPVINTSGECAGALGASLRRVHYGVSVDRDGGLHFLTYEYDALGRLMRTIDPLGRATTFGWNLLYQLQTVQSPAGATYTFCWDERGNLTRAEDPLRNAVELEYTALNRLRSIRDALTPPGKHRVFYGYNATGDLEKVSELTGVGAGVEVSTSYVWDETRGLLQEAWDAEGHRTQQYEYDAYGHPTQVLNALDKGAIVQRNALGWVIHAKNARGQDIFYRYDSWGRLREKRTPEKIVQYQYDLEGRIEAMREYTPSGQLQRLTDWVYDQTTGELQKVVTPEGEVEYDFQRGLLTSLTLRANGQVLKQLSYEYNLANELQIVKQGNTPEVEYVREATTGRLRETRYGNGTRVVYTYENDPEQGNGNPDRVRALEWRAGTTPFRKEVYLYDALGRIQQKEEFLPNTQGGLQSVATVVYTYDHQGQLIEERRTGQHAYTVSYTYDKVGNRLMRTRTVNGQTTTDVMSYNVANQLTSLNGQT